MLSRGEECPLVREVPGFRGLLSLAGKRSRTSVAQEVQNQSMLQILNKVAYRLGLATALIVFVAGPAYSQSALTGRWVWKQPVQKDKSQVQFTVVIHREGNFVRGVYSVDEFIDQQWQGEDGNQTPFRGRVTAGRAKIEFDPDATVPGYEQNVRYKPPVDGRMPGVATLTFRGTTLLWRTVEGRIDRVPLLVTLRRERKPR